MPRLHLWARCCALIALSLCQLAAEERGLTILHFNDLHAALTPDANGRGGVAYLAGTIDREMRGCKQCVVLSAGDLAQGTPVSTIFRGMPVYEIANKLKIDAATLGNHDFDYGWQQTAKFLKAAKFPIVQADIVDGSGRPFVKRPYVILKRNGLRIGVLGVMTGLLSSLTTPATRGDLRTLPLVETVRRYTSELRAKADVIILLAHLSPQEEESVLKEIPEVAAIISGHVHAAEMKQVEGRTLARVEASARELGRLDLRVDTACKCAKSAQWKRIPVTAASAPPAPQIAKRVQYWERRVSETVDVPIGESRRTIAGADLKQLIERATVESLGVDFAFMNRGGVRAPLPAGRLLARHVWNTYPFDNRVVIGRFKGKQLPSAVTQGRSVDPEKIYTLAVNDFTAANQDSPTQLGSRGLEFPQSGPLQRDLLIEWIRKKGVID